MSYRIKTISNILGIPRNTLLAWERRHGLVIPKRSKNGYRTYSEHDLAVLREVQSLTDAGYAISEAVNIMQAKVSAPVLTVVPTQKHVLTKPPTNQLQHALLNFDRVKAELAMRAYRQLGFRALINQVFVPILKDVGEKWAAGGITILQEHYVSGFIHDQMSGMYLQLGCGPDKGPHAICACYPEETHELGLLAISILLVLEGWRVTHLGARVPQKELVDFINEQKPALLCVSVMHEPEPTKIVAYSDSIRHRIPNSVMMIVGGQAVNSDQIQVKGVSTANSFDELKEVLSSRPPSGSQKPR